MANLTVTIDEDVLQRARIRALELGTSVNAVLREYLEAFAGVDDRRRGATESLLAASRTSTSRRGRVRWTRDDLHERR